jgi:PIN domain nuclease of toxin-antitoxin system
MTLPLYLADTHALYWYESHHPQLTEPASRAFQQAEQGLATIILSSVVLAEFYYLLCKLQLESHFPTYLDFVKNHRAYRFEPVSSSDVRQLPSFNEIHEMHAAAGHSGQAARC